MNELIADKIYHPSRGMNIDSNGVSLQMGECVDAVNVVISPHDVHMRDGTSLLGSENYSQPAEDVLHYARYADPVLGAVIMAFCSQGVYRFVVGVGWVELTGYDGASSGLLEGLNIDQWSVTECIDDTVGATLVAAGSVYVRPNEAQDHGSSRALIYYDRTVGSYGEFKTLNIEVQFPIVEEDTGVDGPAVGSVILGPELGAMDAASPNFDSDFTSLEPGTFLIKSELMGTLATSGILVESLPVGKAALGDSADGVSVDCYRLLPVNDTLIGFSGDSYVRVDGLEWSLSVSTDGIADESILIEYEYNSSTQFFPTYVAFFYNSLVLASTQERGVYYPWRVRYTRQGDITKIKYSSYQEVVVSDVSPILDMKVMETVSSSLVTTYLYIYKQGGFVRGAYNKYYNQYPDLPGPLLNLDLALSEGLESTRTVTNVGGMQIYMGLNDVYLFNGTQRTSLTMDEKTGASRVREYIFNNLDLLELDKNFAVYDEQNKRYMLFIKTAQNGGTYPTDCFVYDVEKSFWTRYTYPECSAAISSDIISSGAINDLKGSIQNLDGTISNLTGNLSKRVIFAMTQQTYVSDPGLGDKVGGSRFGGVIVNRWASSGTGPLEIVETVEGVLVAEVGGKSAWEWDFSQGHYGVRWTGTEWQIWNDLSATTCELGSEGETPPEDGWGHTCISTPFPEPGAIDFEFFPLQSYESYLITRDFVGATLEHQDRTELVYIEGRTGELDVALHGRYGLNPAEFEQTRTFGMGSQFTTLRYTPDKVTNTIRFLLKLREGAKFRWLQTLTMPQELTND